MTYSTGLVQEFFALLYKGVHFSKQDFLDFYSAQIAVLVDKACMEEFKNISSLN